MNPEVDTFVESARQWKAAFTALRKIALACPLTEELKWGKPCYTLDHRNVVLIHGFKAYCALLFIKGALLKDEHKLLFQQTENVQAGRQIRFAGIQDIKGKEELLKGYILQAIEIEKAGLKVPLKKTEEFNIPREFQEELAKTPALQAAFKALTPGRQRAYLLYFSAPKQEKTRHARVEKCLPKILGGKGLDD